MPHAFSSSRPGTRGLRGRPLLYATSLSALTALFLLLSGCDGSAAGTATAAPAARDAVPAGQVRIAPASLQMLDVLAVAATQDSLTVWAPARVAFRDDKVASVGTPVDARIIEVHVSVGDRVAAGAPLATLVSPEALRLRHELAAARDAQAVAEAEAARHRTMVDKGVGTEVELAAAQARLREASQLADHARRSAALLGGGENDRLVLRAPRAGVVAARSAVVGAAAEAAGEALFVVGDPSAVYVVAEVFESDLAGLATGARAQVEFSSLSTPLQGRVQRVGAVLNEDTRRAQVFVALDETPPGARPGMIARVGVQVQGHPGMAIPLSAVLIKDESRSIVYVQREDTLFEARTVTLGQPARGFVPVLGGLAAGERVVVRGGLLLDGAAAQLL